MSPPRLGTDDGGPRWFLDGRPLRCGDGVELRVGENAWIRVRWELEWLPGRPPGSPVLHLWVADGITLQLGQGEQLERGVSLTIRGTSFDLRWPS